MAFTTVILSEAKDLLHFFFSGRCRFLASLGMTREGPGITGSGGSLAAY